MVSWRTVVHTLCKSYTFQMDVNDDLSNGDAMKDLYNWSEKKIEVVTDPLVQEILKNLLSRDPKHRGTTTSLHKENFFHPENNEGEILREKEKTHEKFDAVQLGIDVIIQNSEKVNRMLAKFILDQDVPKLPCIIPQDMSSFEINTFLQIK